MSQVVSLLNSDEIDKRDPNNKNISKDFIDKNTKKDSYAKSVSKVIDAEKDLETERSDDEETDVDEVPTESEIEDLINFEKVLAGFTSRDDSVSGTFIR